ncbi:MAG: hypothetical protein NTW32_08280 [Chloroflexi bacterium]|nr:hypothetical protein [Chloroflexota bacterium]
MPGFSKPIFWIFLPLGLVLLILAASRGQLVSAQGLTATVSPTVDRLAKPTMPPNPSQADRGSQDYWLNCSPCHGDRGQGLTDEFRRQYPTEDQNCWRSGCHGRRPYPNGWTIPPVVPVLIGPGALSKFGNGAVLEAFIRAKMPFQKPGNLDADTYWRLTAFLLRENGYWSGAGFLDESAAERVRIPFARTEAVQPTPTLTLVATLQVDTTPLPTPLPPLAADTGSLTIRIVSAGILLLIGLVFFLVIRRHKST